MRAFLLTPTFLTTKIRGRKPRARQIIGKPCIPQLKATRKEDAFHNLAGCVDIYTQFIARADN